MFKNREHLYTACRDGDLSEVNRLLLKVRLYATVNRALQIACEYGHFDLVERILADPRCDPAASNWKAQHAACTNGHVAIYDRLMQDPRMQKALDKIQSSAPRSKPHPPRT